MHLFAGGFSPPLSSSRDDLSYALYGGRAVVTSHVFWRSIYTTVGWMFFDARAAATLQVLFSTSLRFLIAGEGFCCSFSPVDVESRTLILRTHECIVFLLPWADAFMQYFAKYRYSYVEDELVFSDACPCRHKTRNAGLFHWCMTALTTRESCTGSAERLF